MKQVKSHLILSGLLIISLMSITFSGWLLIVPDTANAITFCKITITCPDGRKITCEGSGSCSSDESDLSDPSCSAGGKTKRCSDKDKDADTDTDKNKKKKKNKKNDNSNTNGANTPVTNDNTQ